MRLLRREVDRFEFRLAWREKGVLFSVLEAYPVTPPEHHRLSHTVGTGSVDPNQELLCESMAAHKAECRKRLDLFLANEKRFVRDDSGFRLVLSREEIEWLLPILNDVRVGSWVRLGRPDPDRHVDVVEPVSEDNAERIRHAVLMEVAAHFQYALLAATDGTDGRGWGSRTG